ncbi:MAG: haloacid dehalogenase-like hydrolase [Akkermansia sp.]|nr:haloacid dehalogenase-like hydrolase [Akkermansia sp.]
MRTKFLFDLDGTVTSVETLPLIACAFHIEQQIADLTARTVRGDVPFIDSFIQRVQILGELPVSQISDLLSTAPLYENLANFIRRHPESCCIVTGNILDWCAKLLNRLNCESYGSSAIIEGDKVKKLCRILKKEDIVKKYIDEGFRVVFIGDGNNDAEAMRIADVAIATGLTHYPAKSVLTVADYVIFNEKALCRILNQLF